MSTLKRWVQSVAFHTGLTGACIRGLNALSSQARSGLYVFKGHHVLGSDGAGPGISGGNLHDQLVYLRKHFDVVGMETALEWLDNPTASGRLAVITFDDGYLDNLVHGLPVLRATSTPATVFVCTEPVVRGGALWFSEVREMIKTSVGKQIAVDWLPQRIPLTSVEQAGRVAAQVTDVLTHDGPGARHEKIAELAHSVGANTPAPPEQYRMLTKKHLAVLAEEPLITIGAHTHTHATISSCSYEELSSELHENVRIIEQLTGKKPTVFAYPKGKVGDLDRRTRSLLDEVGFRAAFTTLHHLNKPETDRFLLGRLNFGEDLAQFGWQLLRLSA